MTGGAVRKSRTLIGWKSGNEVKKSKTLTRNGSIIELIEEENTD